ncbi:MAG: hypothetical protein AB1847_17345 [bacterium]
MKNGFHYPRRAVNLSYQKFNHQEEAGYILLTYSFLISFTVIMFAVGYLNYQENQIRLIEREIWSTRAFYIAQAGLYRAAREISRNPEVTSGEDSFDEGTYRWEKDTEDPLRLRAIGQYGSPDGSRVVQRTLEARISQGREPALDSPALYVHERPLFSNLPGIIDGGANYALQSSDVIRTELFDWIPIALESGKDSPYLGKQDLIGKDGKTNFYNEIESWIRSQLAVQNPYRDPNSLNYPLKKAPSFTQDPIPQRYKEGPYEKVYTDSDNFPNNNFYGIKILNTTGWKAVEYADLIVRNEQRGLQLPGGNYYLKKLEVKNNTVLKAEKGKEVILVCDGNVIFGIKSHVGESGQAKNLSLRCYRTGSVIEIRENCEFFGTILAPHCHLILWPGVKLAGSFVVRSLEFRLSGNTRVPWSITYDKDCRFWANDIDPNPSQEDSLSLTDWHEFKEINDNPSSP